MALVAPETVLPGYAYMVAGDAAPVDGIFIPADIMPGLDSTEAATETGSASKVLFHILKAATANYNALATADRTTRMQMAREAPIAVNPTLVTSRFTAAFGLDIGGDAVDLAAE